MENFIDSILTAYVVKRAPDLEAGLRVLLQLRGTAAPPDFSAHHLNEGAVTITTSLE